MIRAYRIAPAATRPANVVECGRCGIEWDDYRYKWMPAAPCRDCRDVLADEGVDLTLYIRPDKREDVAA